MGIAGEQALQFVLISSVNPGAPNGGSGTQYFVGQFDGHRFVPESDARRAPTDARWLDYGSDDYAGVTWSGVPVSDGRTLMLGWMSNWNYAQDVPTERWRSAMTLPRELSLVRGPHGLTLRVAPAVELKTLRVRSAAIPASQVEVPTELISPALSGATLLELEVTLELRTAANASLAFRNAQGDQAVLRINRALQRLELDRSRSGEVGFNAAFAGLQTAPMIVNSDAVRLHVFLDHSSVEVFINDGETVLTALVFPHAPYQSVMLSADGSIDIKTGSVYELGSIWDKQ